MVDGPFDVFVLGLDDLNLETMRATPGLESCRFHQLLSYADLQDQDEIRIPELYDRAVHVLETFDGTVDAVVGYWDFPVTSLVPLLCRRFGLPSADLRSVVACEHKYWSRLEQQKVVSEHPPFALVDLEHTDEQPSGVDFPMWLKPVKSFSSELAFHAGDAQEYAEAVRRIRDGIGRVGGPFEYVLGQVADLPPEIADIGGQACLAEGSIGGAQATVEGYCHDGEVVVYGVVDSLMYPGTPSFLRYQYPSSLPEEVTGRMADVSRRVIRQLGLSDVPFNIEFFWDAERDRLDLLEVNPRHSQSHARLFLEVDGAANHLAMVRLALGQDPAFPHRQGPHAVAAKCFLRHFDDAVVRRIPTPDQVAKAESVAPGVRVKVVAPEGARLSQLHAQDSYSYELAQIFVGADDEDALVDRYDACVRALRFELEPVEEGPA